MLYFLTLPTTFSLINSSYSLIFHTLLSPSTFSLYFLSPLSHSIFCLSSLILLSPNFLTPYTFYFFFILSHPFFFILTHFLTSLSLPIFSLHFFTLQYLYNISIILQYFFSITFTFTPFFLVYFHSILSLHFFTLYSLPSHLFSFLTATLIFSLHFIILFSFNVYSYGYSSSWKRTSVPLCFLELNRPVLAISRGPLASSKGA